MKKGLIAILLLLFVQVSRLTAGTEDMSLPLMEDAKTYYLGKDFARALQLYRSVEALDPSSPLPLQGSANCLYALGRRREALQTYRRALELSPDDRELRARVQQLIRESENWQNRTGLSLGGPRFVALYLQPRDGDFDTFKASVKEKYRIDLQSQMMSGFGWQFEYRFVTTDSGLTALTELVPLVAGLDQGIALPTLSWFLGIRGASGLEFGAGPNVSASGVGFVLAAGWTLGSDELNFPVNLAYALAKDATRVSLSVGYNLPNF